MSSDHTSSFVPVVGIPTYVGTSHHKGLYLRCPTNKKLHVVRSSEEQILNCHSSSTECENFRRLSKTSPLLSQCGLRAETLVTQKQISFKICDYCFCSQKWLILMILFSFLQPAAAAELSLNFQTADFVLLFAFLLALVWVSFFYISKMFTQTIQTAEKFMEENTRRHFWRLGTDIVLSLVRPQSSTGFASLQGYASDATHVLIKFLKVLTGMTSVFCLMYGFENDWHKKIVKFVKESASVTYAVESLENFMNFDFAFPKNRRDKTEDLDEFVYLSWFDGTRYAPMRKLYKETGRFSPLINDEFFKRLTTDQVKLEICQMLDTETKRNYLREMRERAETCDAMLAVLSKFYALSAEEIELAEGNDDRLGVGLAPPSNDLPWFDGSYLMKAAIRIEFISRLESAESVIGANYHNMLPKLQEKTEIKCTEKWEEALEIWKTHCLSCTNPTHKDCDVVNGVLPRLVQRRLGNMAWPQTIRESAEPVVRVKMPEPCSREPAPDFIIAPDPEFFITEGEPSFKAEVTGVRDVPNITIPSAITTTEDSAGFEIARAVDLIVDPPEAVPASEPNDEARRFYIESVPDPEVSPLPNMLTYEGREFFDKADDTNFSPLTKLKGVAGYSTTGNNVYEAVVAQTITSISEVAGGRPKTVASLKPAKPPTPTTQDPAEEPPKKVVFVKAVSQSSIKSWVNDAWLATKNLYSSVVKPLPSKTRVCYNFQFYATRVCVWLGWIAPACHIKRVNLVVKRDQLSLPAEEALELEEFPMDNLHANNNFAGRVLLDSPEKLTKGILSAASVFLFGIVALGSAFYHSRQIPLNRFTRQGYVGASGGKDFDRDLNEWEDSIARGEKLKGRLSRFDEMASSYHDKKTQGFMSGVHVGELLIDAVLQKYVPAQVLAPAGCEPDTFAHIKALAQVKTPQGKLLPDNIGVAMSRTYAVFSDPSCVQDSYLLNAFLIGRYLFSELHNLPDEFWIRSMAGQVYHMQLKNFVLVAGHKDLVYTLWSSPIASRKMSLALPEVGVPVVLVSTRGHDYACKDGITIGIGEQHGWATYNSIAGDCAGPVLNAAGQVVGFHQLGTKVFANGFLKVTPELIALVKQNGELPLIQGSMQSNERQFNYHRDLSLPKGKCIRNKYFCGHFTAFANPRKIDRGLQDYALPSFSEGVLEEGLRRFDHPETNPDYTTLQLSVADLIREISTHIGVTRLSTLEDIHQASDKSSGPGFPFCQKYGTKAALFAAKPLVWTTFGQRPQKVEWYAKLKCEVREVGKAARTYLACPVDFAYYANIMFLDFNNKFYAAGSKLNGFFSTVGMIPQYGGWQQLKDSLFPQGFAFDGKKFDSRVHSFLLWTCCYIRSLKLDEFRLDDMTWCYEQFINSQIVTPEGFRCTKSSGMPSGGVNTIVDNTMVLYLMINYAFRRVSNLQFSKHVKLALNGDDSLITLSREAAASFDARLFAQILETDFGMVFTTESWEVSPIEKLDYLSRRFDVTIKGVTVPWFPFAKIRASLNFSRHPESFAYSLCRAYGILAEMWPHEAARYQLQAYIRWLREFAIKEDPWWPIASQMELPEWQYLYLATGIAPEDDDAVREKMMLYNSFGVHEETRTLFARTSGEASSPEVLKAFEYLRGELQSATPRKRNFAKSLLHMDPKININIAPAGNKKKVAGNNQQKKKPRNNNSNKAARRTKRRGRKLNRIPPLMVATGSNNRVAKIVDCLVQPEGTESIRFGLKYGSRPTAVATVRYKLPCSFTHNLDSDSSAFLFRSLARAALVSVSPRTGACSYAATDSNVRMLNGSTYPYWFHLPLRNVNISTEAYHGPVLFPGKSESQGAEHGYFINAGDTVTIEIALWSSITALVCSAFRYEANGWLAMNQITMTPAAALHNFAFDQTGYYAFRFAEPQGVPPTVPINISASLVLNNFDTIPEGKIMYGQLALPQLVDQFPLVGPIRIQSASLMFTQTTPQIQRGGEVVSAQITQGNDWDEYLDMETLTSLNTQTSATFDATNGSYTFLKPSDVRDFELLREFEFDVNQSGGDYFTTYNVGVRDSFFQITPQHDFLATAIKLPAPAADDKRSGYWTMVWKLEYETNDQWRNLATGQFNSQEVDQALAFLALAPQFHTNAMHIRDLYEWARKKVQTSAAFVDQHGPQMLSVLNAVLKGAGVIAALG